MGQYRTLNHSKFLLHYHIIFICKYRRQLLIPYGDEVKSIMLDIADKSDFTIKEIETDKDHIHMLVESVPKLSPLQIVRKLKQTSTRQMWKLHPELSQWFKGNKKIFWSRSYLVASVSEGIDTDTITAYVRNQGK